MSAVILLFFTCLLYGYGLMVSDAMYFVQVRPYLAPYLIPYLTPI